MLPKKFSTEIFDNKNNEKAFSSLLQQLNKDFILIGKNNLFADTLTPNNLIQALHIEIKSLLINDFQTFLNILYRVDVSENKINHNHTMTIDEVASSATQLILEREWQKVWFKRKNL